MKKSLVNVPVALNVFIRPNALQRVFGAVKKARPSILFLLGDGPRNENDAEKIKICRKIVEDIDWECEVYKLYSEENMGLYAKYFDSQEKIFSIVDRCIFLEDDVLVSDSFFRFCAELLEKYKDDYRVHYVTGLNYLGEYKDPTADYFFAGEGSIWGYATWRRTYLSQNMEYADDDYITNCMCRVAKQLKPGYQKKIMGYKYDIHYEGHIPGPEFYKNASRFSQNQVYIVPAKNMVSNIGIGDGSVHSSDDIRKMAKGNSQLFNMNLYELDFPLKHPKFIVRDIKYEKKVNKILGWNRPHVFWFRKIETTIRCLVYGDIKSTVKKIQRNIKREYER